MTSATSPACVTGGGVRANSCEGGGSSARACDQQAEAAVKPPTKLRRVRFARVSFTVIPPFDR